MTVSVVVYFKTRRPSDRAVRIDGEDCGTVGTPFDLERGKHRFDLEPPADHTPQYQVVLVGGTDSDPQEIWFHEA